MVKRRLIPRTDDNRDVVDLREVRRNAVKKTPNYTEEFKREMVAMMSEPGGTSAHALAQEVGVPQPTLSRWLREEKARQAPKQPQVAPTVSQKDGNIVIVIPQESLKAVDLDKILSHVGIKKS